MRITQQQVRAAIKSRPAQHETHETQAIYNREFKTSAEAELVRRIRDEVLAMPDVREEMVSKIKEAVAKGEYNVTAEDIVDAMIRREVADKLR